MISAVPDTTSKSKEKEVGKEQLQWSVSTQKSKTFLKSSQHTFLFTSWEETDM